MWWLLAREVLRLRGKIVIEKTLFVLDEKKIMPDLYFYRDPEEQKKDEAGEEEAEKREGDVFEGSSKPADVNIFFEVVNKYPNLFSSMPQSLAKIQRSTSSTSVLLTGLPLRTWK